MLTSPTDGAAPWKIRGVAGEKAHLQMAGVGVCWQWDQNTSVMSSGTQDAHSDWPDRSQELRLGPLQYNRG